MAVSDETLRHDNRQLSGVPWQNRKVDKNNLRQLVADTLKKVERDFKVAQFDFLIFVLAADAREWGNQGLNTYPGVLGWKDESQLVTPGGQKIRGGIAIFALSARLGKVFHNIAHILGGVRAGRRVLPDMYDQHLASSSTTKAGHGALQDYRRSQVHMGAWDPVSESAEFIIQFSSRTGTVRSTQMGSITGEVGKGRFQGKKPGCSGRVKIVRQN